LLKRQCHAIFCFGFFYELLSPNPLKVHKGHFKLFVKTKCCNSGKIEQNKHLSFNPTSRVPADEREYMRDQRSKDGSRGNLQMGKVGPLPAARKPAACMTGRKSIHKRSQHLEQIIVNPDMSFDVRNIPIE
jgi:hypothetical protein